MSIITTNANFPLCKGGSEGDFKNLPLPLFKKEGDDENRRIGR